MCYTRIIYFNKLNLKCLKIKKRYIENLYGPTLLISGDDIRRMFDFQKYTAEERYSLLIKYRKFAKFITNQNINLIFAVVGMTDSVRNWYKKNIPNYIEIYIKT